MKNKIFAAILILAITVLFNACQPAPAGKDVPLTVTVSILPEKYFVERIGGEHVAVNVMVGPGESPHSYEPKPEQMAALSRSALYFSIGVEFEDAWLEKITSANPAMRVVDLAQPIQKIPMVAPAHEGEEEGTLDPHIWVSTQHVRVFAQDIYQALVEVDETNQLEYQANLESFLKDIDALEEEMRASLSGLTSKRFFVFHPAWGYLARDFGLEQKAIEISGSEPSAQELAGIIDEAKAESVQVIFAQSEFSTRTAEYVAQEINGKVILISSLEENWLENMRHVAQTFAQVMK